MRFARTSLVFPLAGRGEACASLSSLMKTKCLPFFQLAAGLVLSSVLNLSALSTGALAEEASSPFCRSFRAKRQDVPVYREPNRASEVIGRIARSEEVCGLAEGKDFVSIRWDSAEKVDGVLPHAFVRTVDLWPPRGEPDPERGSLKEWWTLRQNGVVPDDPFAYFRGLLSFFGISPQNAPTPRGTP